MTPIDFILDTILGVFGYNLELIAIVTFCLCMLFLTSITGSKGLLLVSLLGLTVLFAVVVPTYGWVMWALILVSIGLILVGLKIWFSKMF